MFFKVRIILVVFKIFSLCLLVDKNLFFICFSIGLLFIGML